MKTCWISEGEIGSMSRMVVKSGSESPEKSLFDDFDSTESSDILLKAKLFAKPSTNCRKS